MRRSSWLLFFSLLVLIAASSALAANSPADCDSAAKLSEDASEIYLTNPVVAEKKLKEAIGLCPGSASLHLNLGLVFFQSGRTKEAEERVNQAIMLNPNYAKALNAMAYIQYVKAGGDKRSGENLAARAVELEPNNRQYKVTLELYTANVDTPPKTGQRRPDAIGVIIGNKNYRNPTLPAVKFAAQDAAIMKRYLVDSLGYDENNIILMRDASFIDLVKLFGDAQDHRGILYNRVRKGSSEVFIYYSGHGAPDSNTKKAYLIPADADPTVIRLTSYSLDTLYMNLAKLNKEKMPKNITIVLDSCFSGGSQEGMIIPDASPIFIETTTSALNQKNTAVFTSAKGNQISSWYPDKGHSLFTYFFLKTLKTSIAEGKKLTTGDLEKALLAPESVNDVAWRLYNREQEPQMSGDRGVVLFQK